jgi:hypothetical protein
MFPHTQGFFGPRTPVDNLYASPIAWSYFKVRLQGAIPATTVPTATVPTATALLPTTTHDFDFGP